MGLKEKDQLIAPSGDSTRGSVSLTAAVRGWLRRASSHVALYTALIIYTAIGGLVLLLTCLVVIFRELEWPREVARLEELDRTVRLERGRLLAALANTSSSSRFSEHGLAELLGQYEAAVQGAAQGGLLVPLTQGTPPPALAKWTYLQAVFFASTVLTTIGYGNITPATVEGRLFCIMFALVGIPLTLSVLADLGVLLASRLPAVPEARGLKGSLVSAATALSVLLLYIAVGSFLFISWEHDWSFFDGFYFCFVTMTTIGFGDLVPSTPQYMLLCTLYILFGLSLTSTMIEVVRQQYSRSWRHLQALAEALGQLAAGRADLQADLHRVLGAARAKDFELAVHQLSQDIQRPPPPTVLQIIIYETSL